MQRRKGFTLRESFNDGTLEWQRGEVASHIWRDVPKWEVEECMDRERCRISVANEWVGRWKGKKVVILAGGPQMKRMTADLLHHLAEREDIAVIGVNALPWAVKKMFGVDPNKLFDAMVAADAVEGHWYRLWAWDKLRGVPVFRKKLRFKRANSADYWPIVSAGALSLNPLTLFYVDSVTCSINLACIALSTVTREKVCGGPNRDWQVRYMSEAMNGEIILVGVEHNMNNHFYSDVKGNYLTDDPDKPWGDDDFAHKNKGHTQLSGWVNEVGAHIYNAAPWSRIRVHPFVDFEEFLNIPKRIRNGISRGGPPEVGPRKHHKGDCKRYIFELSRHLSCGDEMPAEPKLLEV